MTPASTHCPKCHKKLQAKDSRAHVRYGFPTVKRRRVCSACDFRISTIELPLHFGDAIFKEKNLGIESKK